MSKHERQHFISYRSLSDEFEIAFHGGPLDGATIRTDIYPDHETFVHRVRDRNYVYRYKQVGPLQFQASLDAFEITKPARRRRSALGKRTLIAAMTLAACMAAIAGAWNLLAT